MTRRSVDTKKTIPKAYSSGMHVHSSWLSLPLTLGLGAVQQSLQLCHLCGIYFSNTDYGSELSFTESEQGH